MLPLEELLEKATSLNDVKKYQEVIDLLSDDILENHKNADLYAEKAQACYRLRLIDFCKIYVEKCLLINPNHAKGNNYKGNLEHDNRNYVVASEAYRKAIASNPQYEAPYSNLGRTLEELKQYSQAIDAFNNAIRLKPDEPDAHNGLGNIYYSLNLFDDAIKEYEKAYEIDNNVDYIYNKALALSQLKRFKDAVESYEKYILLTNDPKEYYSKIAQSKIDEIHKLLNTPDLNTVSEFIDKIRNLLLFQDDCVTHYTSLSVAKILILNENPKSKLRLSEGAFLNDTSEGRELFKFLNFNIKPIQYSDTEALTFIQKPFIGSFVAKTKDDDLTLWRMYGKEAKEEARGCALTLDRKALQESLTKSLTQYSSSEATASTNEEFNFYRVAYRVQKEGINTFVIPGAEIDEVELNTLMGELIEKINPFRTKKNSEIQDVVELLNSIAYLFKSAEYQYEHELRLVVKGVGFEKKIDTGLTPPRVFIELVEINPLIKGITLGPKVERAEEWAAAFHYKLAEEGNTAQILISHLPFK